MATCVVHEAVDAGGESLARLEALWLWVERRGDATLSVGNVEATATVTARVMAHGQEFSATEHGRGFHPAWAAILAAVKACEQFESRFPTL